MIKNIIKIFNRKTFPQLQYLNYWPIGAILVKSNKKQYIVTIVTNNNCNHEVVLSNLNGNFEKVLLSVKNATVKLAKDSENFYIVCSRGKNSIIYKFANRSLTLQLTRNLEDVDIASVTADNYYLYLSDSKNGLIYKLDKSLFTIDFIDTKDYDNGDITLAKERITATNNGYISIGMPNDKDEFSDIQSFLLEKFPRKVVLDNNQINSITFDNNNNRLFIAFSNFIAIIENNQCNSFLYLKKQIITSIFYDNDINSLIISSANLKKNFSGYVNVLSDSDINNMKNFILPFEFIVPECEIKKIK